MNILEINEALASQVLFCLKSLGLELDDPHVNPNKNAIAPGYPLSATGTGLALTPARKLQRTGKKYAVVSLYIDVAQCLEILIKNVG
jgi:acetyl-CoA C-acetyltransferase